MGSNDYISRKEAMNLPIHMYSRSSVGRRTLDVSIRFAIKFLLLPSMISRLTLLMIIVCLLSNLAAQSIPKAPELLGFLDGSPTLFRVPDDELGQLIMNPLSGHTEEDSDSDWTDLFVPEEIKRYSLVGFSENKLLYLNNDTLRRAAVLGDEVYLTGEYYHLGKIPERVRVSSVTTAMDRDSIIALTTTDGKVYVYDLVSGMLLNLPSNSNDYQCRASHWISNDENLYLIYSSDMPGGFGGLDIYKTEFWIELRRNGQRRVVGSSPVNFGPCTNTLEDDHGAVFSPLTDDMLLFSANLSSCLDNRKRLNHERIWLIDTTEE